MTDPAVAQALNEVTRTENDLRQAASLYYLGRGAIATLTHAATEYGKAQEHYLTVLNGS